MSPGGVSGWISWSPGGVGAEGGAVLPWAVEEGVRDGDLENILVGFFM